MLKGISALLIASVLLPLSAVALPLSERPASKITFDVSALSSDGLDPRGGGAVSYEFCIPAAEEYVAEVKAIDPSVQHFLHSKGRIGCGSGQYLCIGSTHQPNWRNVLQRVASLDYVARIDRFWGE